MTLKMLTQGREIFTRDVLCWPTYVPNCVFLALLETELAGAVYAPPLRSRVRISQTVSCARVNVHEPTML